MEDFLPWWKVKHYVFLFISSSFHGRSREVTSTQ
jgi:hypothetical protein